MDEDKGVNEHTAEEVGHLRRSKRKLRTEEGGEDGSGTRRKGGEDGSGTRRKGGDVESRQEVPQTKRSYVSMVKGPDCVFEPDSEEEDDISSEGEDESDSEFEYTDREDMETGGIDREER
ncbi:hypothetical protein PIB30_030814 [Stylosanthes scabra]|uniref:Uncharacterized protein n=1 Tax=Stylosanthes scabra TaxID=79078 RepID=A0ABU6RBX1_9FABA|nr:hypothetical protein [Stylosanthes scabra]